jgi:branched-chain amino acid transport system substrate-binding protein
MNKTIKLLTLLIFTQLAFSGCKQNEEETRFYDQHIKVGALVPLTGSGSSPGEAGQAGIQLAVKDIQEHLKLTNPSWQFDVWIEDTETDTVVALQKYNKLKADGIKLIIGPFSSAVLKSLKPHADADKILLISPASVAKSIAQPNDQVFRLLPNIISQSEAVTALMVDDQVEYILPIYRNDIWGTELLETTVSQFQEAGFAAAEPISYNADEQNFESIFTQLHQRLESALQNYPADKIGIYLLSYGEGLDILDLASQDELFSGIRWYGNSAFAENQAIINSPEVANFAENNHLVCPSFGLDPDAASLWQPVMAKLEQELNRKPEIFAFTSYDATWLAVKTYLESAHYPNVELLRKNFLKQSSQYFGTTGWTQLNESGDRNAASYDFWGISTDNASIRWEIKARYNNLTGELIRME